MRRSVFLSAALVLAPAHAAKAYEISREAMCRMSNPSEVISTWARFPEVRRNRILVDLTATITDEERAMDPTFDGYRIAEIDHIWSFGSPDFEHSLQSPLDLQIERTASGFTARFRRGRRGEPTELDGCEDCFEFIPISPRWQYRFERLEGCWALTAFDVLTEEKT